ncbi:hypothetical protein ASF60_17355 [Methylobacterium sp. Leaf113]|nr:hypothetical protein ASF60_17355 [Methylobacterium sp. Leaf113]
MRFEQQFVRLMAAVIVMIIAYVAPSAARAHEGHHPADTAALTTAEAPSAPAGASATPDIATAVTVGSGMPAVLGDQAFLSKQALLGEKALLSEEVLLGAAAVVRVAVLISDDTGRGCCSGPCTGTRCGTPICCASGILSATATLPTLAYGRVVRVSRQVDRRRGLGPETLSRPPRLRA